MSPPQTAKPSCFIYDGPSPMPSWATVFGIKTGSGCVLTSDLEHCYGGTCHNLVFLRCLVISHTLPSKIYRHLHSKDVWLLATTDHAQGAAAPQLRRRLSAAHSMERFYVVCTTNLCGCLGGVTNQTN